MVICNTDFKDSFLVFKLENLTTWTLSKGNEANQLYDFFRWLSTLNSLEVKGPPLRICLPKSRRDRTPGEGRTSERRQGLFNADASA